jgi:membrane protein DedA with SNARE-associated domain
MLPFLAVTFVGATAWNTFLLYCGMKLRDHWPTVQKYSHKIDIVIVVLMVIGIVWWVKVRWPRFRKAQ